MSKLTLLAVGVVYAKTVQGAGSRCVHTSNPDGAPLVLLHHLRHNKTLLEQVVLLSIISENIPVVPEAERLTVTGLGENFWRVIARYGFMEKADVPSVIAQAGQLGLVTDKRDTTYFLGRERLRNISPSRPIAWSSWARNWRCSANLSLPRRQPLLRFMPSGWLYRAANRTRSSNFHSSGSVSNR